MSMNRRKLMATGLALITGMSMLGSVSQADAATRLRIADFYASDHAVNRALREVFVPKLEEYSKGELTASIHDNSSLGAESELTESLRLGIIEMGITGGLISASRPKLQVLEMPYVFRDFDHAWSVFDSPIGNEFAAETEKTGIHVLAWIGNGFRVMTNSVRPINSMADMEGIKMRVPENKVYIETARAFGFNVVTTPFSEVFTALSQGVIDGQENPAPTVLANHWFEVQKYLAITNHIFSYGAISINNDLFKSLSPDQQKALEMAAKEAAVAERRMLAEDSERDTKSLEDAGMIVTRPDLNELQNAVAPARAKLVEGIEGGSEILDAILKM